MHSSSPSLMMIPSKIAAQIYMNVGSAADDFTRTVTRYRAMANDELVKVTELHLRNLGRIDGDIDDAQRSDYDLQVVLVPELCERIRSGSRDRLRRIGDTLAEYATGDSTFWARSSSFRRLLGSEFYRDLALRAGRLRADIASVSSMPVEALIDRVRFAISGSRAADAFGPCAAVYEPAFAYRLVPVLAQRVSDLAKTGAG